MSEQDKERRLQLLLELASTVIILALYWISAMPDWKRQMILTKIKNYVQVPVRDALSPRIRQEVEKFRTEISTWEHEQKRTNP
jgi:hypothetical protein